MNQETKNQSEIKEIHCLNCGNKLGDAKIVDGKIINVIQGNAIILVEIGFCNECHTPFHFRSAKLVENDQNWISRLSSSEDDPPLIS